MSKLPEIPPIEDDRPVLGRDITRFAEAMNFTTLDTSYLLGVYMPMLAQITSTTLSDKDTRGGYDKPGAERPLDDPRKALMLRLLARHPQHCPITPGTTPATVFDEILDIPGMLSFKSRHFGVMLGCELSSPYRWFEGSGVTPIVTRYLGMIKSMLDDLRPEDCKAFIQELMELAEIEAASRGVSADELWSKGTWRRSSKTT